MRFEAGRAVAAALLLSSLCLPAVAAQAAAGTAPADRVLRGGRVITLDARDRVREALAIRAGRIVYVGSNAGAAHFIGPRTVVEDLGGRAVMPGLVDGHMHPLAGGAQRLKCNLEYRRLTLAELGARIQACLTASRAAEPDGWLEVVGWFQEGMMPAGVRATRAVLDALATRRPIVVRSSFGHTALVNGRALALAGIEAGTPDPLGGRIDHGPDGSPSGLLEDSAQALVTAKLPPATANDDIAAARAALDALRRQGVTTFLDAKADARSLAAFEALRRAGELTARAHFALLIDPVEGRHPERAVDLARDLARRYDGGRLVPQPGLTVRNVKLFLDGVISAPALTGAMLEPYFEPPRSGGGSAAWAAGDNRGPEVYFPAPVLRELTLLLARAGLDPHFHADGDRAVRAALDAVQSLRDLEPRADVRPALAHDEVVDPNDLPRFGRLGAIAVLSLQWGKPAPDTVDGARDYLGPARYRHIEPYGELAAAGARIAFGSDWPVDPLDEWRAFAIGVTRSDPAPTDPRYAGRLGDDPGLARGAVLRAATLGAAYELRQERETGSIEAGKLADLIVLDRDVHSVPVAELASTRVLETLVGGRVVYRADEDATR